VKIYGYNDFVVFYLHFGVEMVLKRDAAISIVSTINLVLCDQCLWYLSQYFINIQQKQVVT